MLQLFIIIAIIIIGNTPKKVQKSRGKRRMTKCYIVEAEDTIYINALHTLYALHVMSLLPGWEYTLLY